MAIYGVQAPAWHSAPDLTRRVDPDGGSASVLVGPRLTRRGRLVGALLAFLIVGALIVVGVSGFMRVPVAPAGVVSGDAATARVVVRAGDSLWAIALRSGVDGDPADAVARVRALNGLESNLILPGQVLLVPVTP